jgi:O-antigen ligase
MTTTDALPADGLPDSHHGVATWTILGAAIGLLGLELIQLAGSWALYSVLALVALPWVPSAVRLAGGTEALLRFAFVFALQLQLGFHVIYADRPKPAGSQGVYVSLVLVVAAALAGWWILQPRAQRRLPLVVLPSLLQRSLWFCLATLLSVLNTRWTMMSVFGVWEVCVLALVALVAARACATPDGVAAVFTALRFSLLFQSTVILAEHATRVPLSLTQGVSRFWVWGAERFAGTLGAPSAAGTFLAVNLLFVIGHGMLGERRDRSPWTRVTIVAGAVALLLTQTRSAWVAMLLGFAGLLWTHRRQAGRAIRLGPIVRGVALAAVLLLLMWPIVGARLSVDHVGAFMQRWYLIQVTARMLWAHPAIGVGINTATEQVWSYARSVPMPSGIVDWVFVAHNQFVLVAGETGLLGLAAFVAVFATAMAGARRAMHDDDRVLRGYGTMVFWALVMMVWALNVDMVAATTTYVFLWFLFGMAAGLRAQTLQPGGSRPGTATP